MAVSRRSLAETYEAQDLIIQAAQDVKREATKAYREYLDGRGMDKDAVKAEVEGFKKAFRRKMDGQKKGTEAVEHVDAIADEIYLEITAPAPRATRVAIDVPSFSAFTSAGDEYHYDAETGEITEPQPTKAAVEAARLGTTRIASSVENEAAEISTSIIEQQDAPHPASDLTNSPQAPGQVAPIQLETATSGEGATAPATGESPVMESAGDTGAQPAGGGNEEVAETVPNETENACVAVTGKPVEALASAAPAKFDARKLRPNCQVPFACRGMGREHCFKCKKAMAEGEAA